MSDVLCDLSDELERKRYTFEDEREREREREREKSYSRTPCSNTTYETLEVQS